MPTLGATGNPSAGWDAPGAGYSFASQYTVPAGGALITAIHAYFDRTSGATTGAVCVWNSGGGLIASVNVTLNTGGLSAGAQSWHVGTLSTPIFVAAGSSIWIGGHADAGLVFSSEVGGGSNVEFNGSSGPGGFGSSSGSGIGTAGAYVDYISGTLYAFDGSSFQAGAEAYAWDGSAWRLSGTYAFDGSSWIQIA